MFSTFFYADASVSLSTFASAFLKVMANDEGYDEDCDIEAALQGLASAIEALYPARNAIKVLVGTIKGPEAEKLFLKSWVIGYADTVKSRGFPVQNPLEGQTGPFNPKDEEQARQFVEDGNSPDWNNPVANGDIEAPRWLLARAGKTLGEIDGARAAEFYKYAREQEAKKRHTDETRDPETKP